LTVSCLQMAHTSAMDFAVPVAGYSPRYAHRVLSVAPHGHGLLRHFRATHYVCALALRYSTFSDWPCFCCSCVAITRQWCNRMLLHKVSSAYLSPLCVCESRKRNVSLDALYPVPVRTLQCDPQRLNLKSGAGPTAALRRDRFVRSLFTFVMLALYSRCFAVADRRVPCIAFVTRLLSNSHLQKSSSRKFSAPFHF